MNGGPGVPHIKAFSFQVETEDQAETDRYWATPTAGGGAESMCGWCRDRLGLSWQITPGVLGRMIADAGRGAAKRAMQAVVTIGTIDIATSETAFAVEAS